MKKTFYQTILVPVESSEYDKVILDHIVPLAQQYGSKLLLVHVADGWAARYYREEADSPEVRDDRRYLQELAEKLRKQGLEVETILGFGDPGEEIIKLAQDAKLRPDRDDDARSSFHLRSAFRQRRPQSPAQRGHPRAPAAWASSETLNGAPPSSSLLVCGGFG